MIAFDTYYFVYLSVLLLFVCIYFLQQYIHIFIFGKNANQKIKEFQMQQIFTNSVTFLPYRTIHHFQMLPQTIQLIWHQVTTFQPHQIIHLVCVV